MKATPLLFKAEMIQALLREIDEPGTGKTMTRRVVKPAKCRDFLAELAPCEIAGEINQRRDFRLCPYGKPGDLIWCRETWCSPERGIIGYRANAECGAWIGDGGGGTVWRRHGYILESEHYSSYFKEPSRTWGIAKYGGKWKPSIFMPRWASRITLLIEEVRVERLWDISIEDILREGIFTNMREHDAIVYSQNKWKSLWISINGQESWDRNDWLWVLRFRPILANVDAVIANPEMYGIKPDKMVS